MYVLPSGTLHLQEISSKPTLDDLHKLVVPEVASNWKSLARILGVKDSLIRIVAKKYPNDCVEACQGVLFHWLKGKQHTGEQDRTWSILLTALDSAGFVQLERELRRKYFQGKLVSFVPFKIIVRIFRRNTICVYVLSSCQMCHTALPWLSSFTSDICCVADHCINYS